MTGREQTIEDLMALGASRPEAEAIADQGASEPAAADSPRRGRRRVAGRLVPRRR